MKYFKVSEFRNSSILRIYSLKNQIQVDPEYQRMSEIWNLEKRQLLMDSIINDFDIPKIYFHEFRDVKKSPDGSSYKFAIIDGKQRLEAIWAFIDGKYCLDDDIKYYADDKIKLCSLTYAEIADKYPHIKEIFDSFTLPIITVETDDIDMIEELFSRLNEAVPLNAAEKRNALGGPLPPVIRKISQHNLFKDNVAFSNKRYQFRELACKFLWLYFTEKVVDTKKAYLDAFVESFKIKKRVNDARALEKNVTAVLDSMAKIFIKRDPLLRTVSMPVIYFLVIKDAKEQGWFTKISRKKLLDFDSERRSNRTIAEKDISKADYEFLEFDRMTQQGTNDGASIIFRKKVLTEYLNR